MDLKNINYLTIDKTNQMKGLLIILVIFGHIKGLTSTEQQSLLYVFHVASFLILPFLFNEDRFTYENIKKVVKRYYIPFVVFFFLSAFAYSLIILKSFDLMNILTSLFISTAYNLRISNGISAYWFFPALVQLLIVLMFYNSLSRSYQFIFLFLALILHLSVGYYSLPNSDILQSFPMSGYIWMYLFILGILIKRFISTIQFNCKIMIMTFFIFLLSSYIFYGNKFNLASPLFPNVFTNPLEFILVDIIIITGFLTVLFISQKMTFLISLGKYSLGIYLIHPFLIQVLDLLFKNESYYVLLTKFVLVTIVSLIIVFSIYKFNLNKYIFPR